jgi:kinesin family protein 6/9
MNQASSRSHCIFVLNIKGLDLKTNTEIFSKINLVDLAGSERVSKSQAEGIVLTEAKSINLSLSYLEQVIVSLNEKAKGKNKVHIPYRNSLLTTLLKDSLGGNCKTVMMATIASELDNIEETISTLRFAQRVRQLKN